MSNLVKNTSLNEFAVTTDETTTTDGTRFHDERVESYPVEFTAHSSTYRLLGVTIDANPVYAAANRDHNGITPSKHGSAIAPAFDVLLIPSDAFADAVPTDQSTVDTELLTPTDLRDAGDGWASITDDNPPVTRGECIDLFKTIRWQDTTSYLELLVEPSLDAFPEKLNHKGFTMHLLGVTETGLAYYDTMDTSQYTICTIVDGDVVEFAPHESTVSMHSVESNHLPYAQYLSRVALDGDGWNGLTSVGKTYLSDYIDSITELRELTD